MTQPDTGTEHSGVDPTSRAGNYKVEYPELEVLMGKEVGPVQTIRFAREIVGEGPEALKLSNGFSIEVKRKVNSPTAWAPDYVPDKQLAYIAVPTEGSRPLITNPEVLGSSGEPKLGALNGVIRNSVRLLKLSSSVDAGTYESQNKKGGLSTASKRTLESIEQGILLRSVELFKGSTENDGTEVDALISEWAGCSIEVARTLSTVIAARISDKILPKIAELEHEGVI